mmetsp:Transcript_47415/g.143534  ORF Transcript_47415/g.143534 Transcript_47415/m.143534 type:complete len:212 (-) Transcript_47415:274-909(-)
MLARTATRFLKDWHSRPSALSLLDDRPVASGRLCVFGRCSRKGCGHHPSRPRAVYAPVLEGVLNGATQLGREIFILQRVRHGLSHDAEQRPSELLLLRRHDDRVDHRRHHVLDEDVVPEGRYERLLDHFQRGFLEIFVFGGLHERALEGVDRALLHLVVLHRLDQGTLQGRYEGARTQRPRYRLRQGVEQSVGLLAVFLGRECAQGLGDGH